LPQTPANEFPGQEGTKSHKSFRRGLTQIYAVFLATEGTEDTEICSAFVLRQGLFPEASFVKRPLPCPQMPSAFIFIRLRRIKAEQITRISSFMIYCRLMILMRNHGVAGKSSRFIGIPFSQVWCPQISPKKLYPSIEV